MLQVIWKCVVLIVVCGLLVIVNEEYCFVVVEQLQQVGVELVVIIFELVGCNIVLVIVVVVLEVICDGGDVLLLVLLFDYVIINEVVFCSVVQVVVGVVEVGKLVIFGIVLIGLEIGYGYIKVVEGQGLCVVECFVEKFDLDIVIGYVSSGQYYWNSGMFLFKVLCYLQELECFQFVMLVGSCQVWQQVC